MDLLVKTKITPTKIILTIKRLFRNLKLTAIVIATIQYNTTSNIHEHGIIKC